MVLEKTLESPLDCKEIQPVHSGISLEGMMLKLKLQYFVPEAIDHRVQHETQFSSVQLVSRV